MKTPSQCENLKDIRNAIDEIDREVVALIGKRAGYVRAAAGFKKDQSAVKAPERVAAMLETRADWARKENLDPQMITELYANLIHHFIDRELNQWKQQS